MAVTCCVLAFSRTIMRLPVERSRWVDAVRAQPTECPAAGQCSPGGCRKHCGIYASGEWLRRNNQPKDNRPPKAKGKR